METIILNVAFSGYLSVFLLILCSMNFLLFISFLFGKEEYKLDEYFKMLFGAYSRTKLRKLWGALLFGIMYIGGIICLVFIKIAWYPAQWIRQFIRFTFYNTAELQREQDLKNLKDKE